MQNNKGQEEKEKFIMKKLLASLMALSMVFAVTGCSESSDSSSESKAEAKQLLQLQPHLLSSLRLTQQLQLQHLRSQLLTQQLPLTTQTQQATATRLRQLIRIMFTQAICILSRSTQRSGQCRSPLVLT